MTATLTTPDTEAVVGPDESLIVEEPTDLGSRLRWAVADGWTVARRNLTHVRHVPEKLLDVTLQPIIFVLLFTYVFGGSIIVPGGGSYVEFLMAGIFVQTMTFTSVSTAISIADDVHNGILDRLRSLPMSRSAVLSGRTGADLLTSVLGVTVLALTGLAVGWRVHEGLASMLAAFLLLLFFGYAVSWLGTLLGLFVRAPEAAQAIVFMVAFPLTFVANTFVPIAGMPSILQTVAEWNPISAVVTAMRELFGNAPPVPPDAVIPFPLQHAVLTTLVWSALILVVSVPLAIRQYRRAVAR